MQRTRSPTASSRDSSNIDVSTISVIGLFVMLLGVHTPFYNYGLDDSAIAQSSVLLRLVFDWLLTDLPFAFYIDNVCTVVVENSHIDLDELDRSQQHQI